MSLALAAAAAGCAAAPPAPGPSPAAAPPTAAARQPSRAALMVCGGDVEREVTGALGTALLTPLTGSWVDPRYTCPYVFPGATLALVVDQTADRPAAEALFERRRAEAAGATAVDGLGEAAFARPDGSVVVRKDSMLLLVDVAGLPAGFGTPVRSRANIALTVATAVMTCWREHA
ncbi:hypothetical protein ACGFX4_14120 [Kitasatospora sp. NPDC048365]|uniref:hypothetical protein n=1 Tax=Kitasatospora sp. NPDC048365 TaxID=3364050 RepID=UPI00371AF2F0